MPIVPTVPIHLLGTDLKLKVALISDSLSTAMPYSLVYPCRPMQWSRKVHPARPRRLNANENLFVVEVAGKQQNQAEAHRCDRQIAGRPQAVADRPAHDALGDAVELDQVPRHVDGQGITADPEENRCGNQNREQMARTELDCLKTTFPGETTWLSPVSPGSTA